MGENQDNPRRQLKIKFEPQYFLFILSLVILLLFIIAFARPVYPASLNATAEPTMTKSLETEPADNENLLTTTPTLELEPPTPEEIGYTDGIIFWSTVLIIILLVGTLRESLQRKDKSHRNTK